MTQEQLIHKLIEKKVNLIYGKDDLPVALSYNAEVEEFIKKYEEKIKAINRQTWENLSLFVGGTEITGFKPFTYSKK